MAESKKAKQDLTECDLAISDLGPCAFPSPLKASLTKVQRHEFVDDSSRIRTKMIVGDVFDETVGRALCVEGLSFESAGPRAKVFFDPEKTGAAIVTCGGICPGLNNVIRCIVLELSYNYGIKRVLGIRSGYAGMNPDAPNFLPPLTLDVSSVRSIHDVGGTILGSTRGPQPVEKMVDFLLSKDIQLLFCIGGDGTQRGADAISKEVARRGVKIAVVGIPKTIDNDIPYVSQSFGYATALGEAAKAIKCAHVEATSAENGVGVVKLMGRDAGFIAAGASLASQEANYCFVPEVDVDIPAFLDSLTNRIKTRGHAVVVVAEGAFQKDMASSTGTDASGNKKLADSGLYVKGLIDAHFSKIKCPCTIKYIDPSYIVRSVPANPQDSILCDKMARSAVHAAMAGKTGLLIGYVHDSTVHVPISLVCGEKKRMCPKGDLWTAVLMCTGMRCFPAYESPVKGQRPSVEACCE